MKKRNYITLEKGKLIPTDTGYALIDALPDIAVNPDMTALWAEKQAAIENGDLTVEEFINELYSELSGMITDVDLGEMKIEAAAPTGQSQRLNAPALPVVSRLLSGQKVISVQDVNLKSGRTSLARLFLTSK